MILFKTISNIKYKVFKVNSSNGFRIETKGAFVKPVFFTYINSLKNKGSLRGSKVNIVDLNYGNYRVDVFTYTSEMVYQTNTSGGLQKYTFNIPPTEYITFDAEFVWNNIPNGREKCLFYIESDGSFYFGDDIGSYLSGDLVLYRGFLDKYLSPQFKNKNIIGHLYVYNNTPSTHYTPTFRMGHSVNVLKKNDTFEATILVVEGDDNIVA